MAQETQPVTESSLAEERKREYTEADREEVRKQLPWLFRQKWLLPIFLGAVLIVFGEKLLPVVERIAGGIAATFQWGVLLIDGLWNWAAARLTLFDVAVLICLGLILGSLARIRRRLDRLIEKVQQIDLTAENRMEQEQEEDDSDA